MKLIRGIHNLSQAPQEGCVLTIGNFDGVHRGHQELLRRTVECARAKGLFDPQSLTFAEKFFPPFPYGPRQN